MTWEFDNNKAIYSQIVEQMTLFIISGKYEPASRLPSVRELANEAAVNPNTMQKALSYLEGSGLVYTNRTSGRFITEDSEKIAFEKKKLADEKINDFFEHMEKIGFSKSEIVELIDSYKQK